MPPFRKCPNHAEKLKRTCYMRPRADYGARIMLKREGTPDGRLGLIPRTGLILAHRWPQRSMDSSLYPRSPAASVLSNGCSASIIITTGPVCADA